MQRVESETSSQQRQMTKFTFTQAVEIPGRVLPAGTYRFVLQKGLKWQ